MGICCSRGAIPDTMQLYPKVLNAERHSCTSINIPNLNSITKITTKCYRSSLLQYGMIFEKKTIVVCQQDKVMCC